MRSSLICLAAACAVISCNTTDKNFVTPVPIEPVASLEMRLLHQSPALVGDTALVKCVAHAKDGRVIENAPITFTSSAASVASVVPSGQIFTVGKGTTVITAQSGAVTASDSLTVLPVNTVANIKVQPMSLDTGQVVPAPATVVNPRGAVITVVPVPATVLNPRGAVIADVPVTYTSADSTIASVSNTGNVRGVTYGSTSVTVSADTVSRSLSVDVAPWPHEPAGSILVTERDFSSLATSATDTVGSQGWDAHEEVQWPRLSIISDPTAPRSPPSVLQALYPAGTTGGSPEATPGRLLKDIPGNPSQVYFSVWVKLSANWQANPTGTNKILFVWINGQPRFFLSAEGTSASNLLPTGRLQGTPDDLQRNREKLSPNASTTTKVQPGTWQRWEVVLVANTPGSRNGQFHLWVDGIEVANFSDVEYLAPGDAQTFTIMDIEPIWGGGGGTLTEAQTMDFDHIYVSIKP